MQQQSLTIKVRRRCGCDVLSVRAKALYVLLATSWASIVLALRFPFLATILTILLGRFFITMPVFLLWFMVRAQLALAAFAIPPSAVACLSRQNTLLCASMLWMQPDVVPIVSLLGIMQGVSCAIVDLVIYLMFPVVSQSLFLEPDGTVNIDWSWLYSFFTVFTALAGLSAAVYIVMAIAGFVYLLAPRVPCCALTHATAADDAKTLAKTRALHFDPSWFADRSSRWYVAPAVRRFVARYLIWMPAIMAVACSFAAIGDYMTVTGSSCGPNSPSCHSNCDPIDTTACVLPFPSSYYLANDTTSATGYRVAFTAGCVPSR